MTLEDLYHANMNWTIDTRIDIRFPKKFGSGESNVFITEAVMDFGFLEVAWFQDNYVVLK